MPTEACTIAGLGEVLWDVFPTGKQLGGAPTNFAYMTRLLGDRAIVASRIGSDPLGTEAERKLAELSVQMSFLQIDFTHPTGTVKVQVDNGGQPQFEIAEDVAWDFLEWTPQWHQLAEQVDAVCFGSLAQRSVQSRETIRNFLRAMRRQAARIFDVNLRQVFYSAEVVSESMKLAHIVKLNHEELPKVMQLLGSSYVNDRSSAEELIRMHNLKLVCVTRGRKGSLLVDGTGVAEHPGFQVEPADTVGAGDAFTAGLVHHYLRGASLGAMNEAANRLGAWVTSQVGGTPVLKAGDLEQELAGIK